MTGIPVPEAAPSRVVRMAVEAIGPLLAAAVVLGLGFWIVRASSVPVTIRADLELTGGSFVEVFLNDSPEPIRTPVIPRRQVYRFTTTVSAIDAIRLDPVDVSDVAIRCHGIEVVGADGAVLAHFSPQALASWTARELSLVEQSPDVVVFQATGQDPAIISRLSGDAAVVAGGSWAGLVRAVRADSWRPYFYLLPFLSLIQLRPFRSWALRTAVVLAVVGAWPAVYDAVFEMDWGSMESSIAVSRAFYEGISLPSTQMAVAVGFAGAGLLGLVVGFWRPGRRAELTAAPGAIRPWELALTAGLILVMTAPDLPWSLAWLQSVQYSPHWDDNNLLYWAYWTSHGQLPLRDFWYPYGGLFLLQLPWPAGPLISWAAAAGRFGVFAVALMLASPGRRWSAWLAVAALMVAQTSGLNFAVHRYLLAANVVLAYVAAARWEFRGWLPRIVLGTALVMCLVFEPAQLLYAIPGVAAVALLTALGDREWRAAWRGPGFCAAVVLAATVPLVAALWMAGMLPETWLFYQRLGDTAEYAAFPSPVDSTPWPDFPLESVVVWFPAVLMAVALAELRRPDPQARIRALALAGLAVVDFMVLQKHLIRMMPETLVLNAFIAGLVFGVLGPSGRRRVDRYGVAAGLGLLGALLLVQGRWDERMDLLPRLPGRMIGTGETLVSPAAWRAANSARFAPERFEQYKLQRELVAELTRRRGRSIRVFALTDDPILYLLSGQPPTWHANLYNGSPVYEQERIIDELRAHPPDFVVALRGRVVFDGMPLNVRVPDVLSYVIAEYVPESPVDDWVVLRPRQPGEAVSPAFWRDLLGETLDLGMLPARLAAREDTACIAGRLCDEVLLLDWLNPGRPDDGGPAGPVDIRMDIDGVAATIRVRLVPGQRRYVLPLSRVWPSMAARAAGVNLVAMPPAEIALTWAQWGRPPTQLY